MTYTEALNKIHSLLTFGSRPGLDRVRELLRRMGDPQDKLRYIHVAGTNGKGSVCAMLSAILVAAGYKTGLFISPYITDFRERIQINNAMVSEEVLTDAVEKTFPLIEQLRAEGIVITEFEYVNALEFYIHAQAECDIVVLETGMGGLLDCTNVIRPPLCAVITTIPLIKSSSVSLELRDITLGGSEFLYQGAPILLRLAGDYQLENARTALAAIEVLTLNGELDISPEDIRRGLFNAVNPARLETLCGSPLVLLDGAHNPNGIGALKQAIDRFLEGKKILCVLGMLADKDIDSALRLLDGVFEAIYTVPIDNPRALAPDLLAEKCRSHAAEVRAFDSAELAFDTAFERAERENAAVLVCGSLYLAGSIRPYILTHVK